MKWNWQFVDNDRSRTYLFILLLAFYFLAVLIHLEYYPLNGEEPRRALIAIEMRHSGNYIMPTSLGWEYYNKPPIYNWLISASMFLTGTESEIPVRLPSLVFIILWAVFNYLILKRFLSREIAALSSLFLLTSFDILFWGMNNGGEIDIFYSFLVYMQVISLFYFNYRKNWFALYAASYFFCALGFLTKGFPSILFQGLTLLALCYYNRSFRLLFRWQHLAGLVIFILGAGSYFYAYSFQGSPARLLTNLLKESFNKSAIGDYPERILRKILVYPFSFLKILLPWSLLLLLLLKRRRLTFWSHPFIRFSIIFILFNVPVYWFTGHPKMRYSYVFIPFSMTILAFIFYEFKNLYPQLIKKVFNGLILLFILALIFVFISPLLLNVNAAWLILVIAILIAYLYLYKKALLPQVWFFGAGIVLLRFIYASLYMPGMYQEMELRYDQEMARLAEINKFQPVSIYSKPEMLDLSIDLKVARFHYDSIPVIPFLAYQIPYYYYRTSGKLVTYDTTLRSHTNYIGFRSSLGDLNTEILYSYKDLNHNGDSVVLFRLVP